MIRTFYSDEKKNFHNYNKFETIEHVKAMALEENATFYIDLKDDLYARGSNDFGQLGDDSFKTVTNFKKIMSDVKSIYTSGKYTVIVENDGTIYTTGENTFGQIGDGTFKNRNVPIKLTLSKGSNSDKKYSFNDVLGHKAEKEIHFVLGKNFLVERVKQHFHLMKI